MNRLYLMSLLLLLNFPVLVLAQEPIFMEAATQPGVGLSYLRTQLRYRELDGAKMPDADEYSIRARYTYGLRYNISLNAEADFISRDLDDHSDLHEFDDPRFFAKWRVLQYDLGPVNTIRGSLIGGAEVPLGSDKLSSDSTDPFGGGVITAILGRHGLNAALIGQLNTGDDAESDSELHYDASYLYRLSPTQWDSDTKASFYLVTEFNGTCWEGGDKELLFAPGLLYEATRWALELGIRFPLCQDVSRRYSEDFALVIGWRYLF
jgi:hypothetical protein